ncbi:stressosome-associated protein Prli42 [Fictibacillus sp. Mic-4]|nr:stressosome-associated protein Prli42 [Fictibacillus gelatini]
MSRKLMKTVVYIMIGSLVFTTLLTGAAYFFSAK